MTEQPADQAAMQDVAQAAGLRAGVVSRTQRPWTDEETRSICFQTAAPGAAVAQVARRCSGNANLIFRWMGEGA